MSIIQKIILWFLALTLIPIMVVGSLAYASFNGSFKQKIMQELDYQAATQQHRTEDAINQNQERLTGLTNRYILPLTLERYSRLHKPEDRELLNNSLKTAKSQISSFKEISILDPGGIVAASTNSAHLNANYAAADYFATGKQHNDAANYLFTDSQGNLKLRLVGPLMFNNKLVGVIVIESNVQDILSTTSDYTGLGKTGETELAKPDGKGGALILTPLRFDAKAILTRHISNTQTSEPILRAIKGEEVTIDNAIDYRNQPVLAATRHIKETGWGLSVKIDQSEAYEPIAELRDTLLILIFLLLVLGVFIALFAARNLIEPVLVLSRAANEMSKGDFKQRIDINSEDELGKLGAAFNAMADELDKLDQIKSEFILLASHQLRTPLTAIKWSSEELVTPSKPKSHTKQKQYLNQIHDSTERMIKLVTELLNASKIELGNLPMDPQPVNITAVLKQVLEDVAAQSRDGQINMVKIIDKQFPLILIDPSWAHVILQNLISNAIKYSPPKQTVTITISKSHDKILMTVADQGYGIPKNQQDKIFTKLFRADNARMLIGDGSGLGLYITKAMVEQSGGKIWFESIENHGTTFYIELPVNSEPPKKKDSAT